MIKNISDLLIKLFIKNHDDINDPFIRSQYGILEGWISIVTNLVLGLIKIVLAILYGSISLMADAIHTLSDMGTSLLVIIGFKIGQKPGDKEHPFGHGRMEPIASLIIAVLLGVGGIELIQYSIKQISNPQLIQIGWLPIILVLLTIFIKEGLGQISKYLAVKINSIALEADAWHHRTDAISSLLVIIALIATKFGFGYLDGIVGMLIGGYIIYIAYDIAKRSVDQLLGESPNQELLSNVRKIALKNPKVKNIHDVIIHEYGFQKILSLHLEIPEDLTLSEAHTVAEQVELELEKQLNIHTTIHLDPVLPPSPESIKIEKIINEFINADERLESYHDLRIIGEEKHSNLLFEIVITHHLKLVEKREIKNKLSQEIKNVIPGIKNLQIQFDPKFTYSP